MSLSAPAWTFFTSIIGGITTVIVQNIKNKNRITSVADKADAAVANTTNVANGFAAGIKADLKEVLRIATLTQTGLAAHIEHHDENEVHMTTVLDAAKALGATAKGYRFGTDGPDYYDCSGLIFRACQNADVYLGARFTTYSVVRNSQFERVTNPRIDDIVVWSENAVHGHMGVISGPDEFYSARSVEHGLGYLRISTFHVYPVSPIYLRPVKTDGYKPPRDLYLTTPHMHGADVGVVQRAVHAPDDDDFGPVTSSAVKTYQRAHGLGADGIVGPNTRATMGIKE